MMMTTALLFLHIPKAGGTTLHGVIERHFAPEITYSISGMMPSQSIKEFIELAPERRERIRLVKGHMPYGLHKYLSVPATYITMLRDPVDRVVSHYYFVRRSPGVGHHEEVTSGKMSLEDFVRERAAIRATNDQTRLISGDEKVNAKLLSGGARANEEAGTTDILGLARKNLEDHFVAVGLSEKFDESLLLFRKLLGWKNIYYVKQNVTKGRPAKQQVARETVSLIEKHNDQDMALYEFARQRFEEAVKEYGERFESELRSFRRNNRLYGTARRGYLLTRSIIKAGMSKSRQQN
ncbi:MAG: sulfotransferase family 2 domain-containing protein [Pyrinomonadaceae bacterium]